MSDKTEVVLRIKGNNPVNKDIEELFQYRIREHLRRNFKDYEIFSCGIDWYMGENPYHESLKEFSRYYPENLFIFTLFGADITWREYYKNGKHYAAVGVTVYSFNEAFMK